MGASIFFTAAMIRALGQRGYVAMLLCVLCTKCTLHSNHRLTVWYSDTQNDFYPGAAIFSLHTLASPSGRNVNYDEKQLTGGKKFVDLFLLSLQVLQTRVLLFSYNFCNTGVHYETPCINSTKGTQILCWNYILLNPLSMGEIHFKCATVTPHDYHQFCTRCTTSTPPGRIWLIIEDSYTTANHRRFSTNRTIFTEQVLSPHGRNHHVRR